MTGFEPGSSGIVSDRSANCATTTSLVHYFTSNTFARTSQFGAKSLAAKSVANIPTSKFANSKIILNEKTSERERERDLFRTFCCFNKTCCQPEKKSKESRSEKCPKTFLTYGVAVAKWIRLSLPTILRPWVRIPTIPSMIFPFIVKFCTTFVPLSGE